MATLPPPVVLKPEGSDEEPRPVQTTPHQTDQNPDAKGARGGGIDCGVSTPALAGPGQPEAPPSPHLDRWPGTLKPHPPVFLAPGPVLGAQQFRSRPRPRARPCPRSLFNLHFHFLTLSIRPTLPVAHHHPTVHCLAAIPGPKAPPTTHLASSGPTRRSVQAAEAHRPDLATLRSGESRSCAQPQNTIHPPSTTARPPTCAARPRPFPTPGPRRKGGPRRGNIGGAAHHHVPCPARLLLTRPRRGRRQQTRWSGTRCCRPLPSGPTSCP